MISNAYWKRLTKANRMLRLSWETLEDARADCQKERIERAELAYFQSLQGVFSVVQEAVVVAERKQNLKS